MNNPSAYWGQVSALLLPFGDIPEFEPPPSLSIQTSTSAMEIQMRLFHEEEPVEAEVEMAIRAWPSDRASWTRLGEHGAYFLRLRSESSLEFVSMLLGAFDYDGRQMFKDPDVPPVDFSRYLLTEWWMSAGREMAAKNLILKWHAAKAKK